MKPNKATYFNHRKNSYISNSKIKDFLLDRDYFKRKHIDFTVPDSQSDAMVIGSAVDCILTAGREFYNELYRVVERRNFKNKPEGYTELTPSQSAEIESIVSAVERTSVYKFIKSQPDLRAQEILCHKMPLGLFDGICGIPDWFWIGERMQGKKKIKYAVIIDLKTSRDSDRRRYYWTSRDLGYFLQQAMYQELIRLNFGVEMVDSFHLVVEKDDKNINKVSFYRLDQHEIDEEIHRLNHQILPSIREEKEFNRSDVAFENWELLSRPDKE